MAQSHNSCAQHYEIQHLLIALDQLGKDFGDNRDTHYSLGRYLGYKDSSLPKIESQKDPLSWILCDTTVKTSNDIPELVSTLEQYFIKYGLWENYQHFITRNGFSSVSFFLLETILTLWKHFFNQTKGFRADYSLWNRTHNTVLCQMIVTHIPDKVTRDKLILLDTKLDVRDKMSYFLDDLVTSYYKLG